jgi:hypothetical protein
MEHFNWLEAKETMLSYLPMSHTAAHMIDCYMLMSRWLFHESPFRSRKFFWQILVLHWFTQIDPKTAYKTLSGANPSSASEFTTTIPALYGVGYNIFSS